MNNNLITLLSTLVGGLLTIIGGFVGNYFSLSLSRSSEKRKLFREKIEEIYTLATQVKEWYDFIDGLNSLPSEEEFRLHPCPINRVVMLTRLYVPKLSSSVADVGLSVEKTSRAFQNWYENHIGRVGNAGDAFTADDQFKIRYQKLLDGIEVISHRYI